MDFYLCCCLYGIVDVSADAFDSLPSCMATQDPLNGTNIYIENRKYDHRKMPHRNAYLGDERVSYLLHSEYESFRIHGKVLRISVQKVSWTAMTEVIPKAPS